MFGYVKPYVPDMRVREHETYRGLYCGLCRTMGHTTGFVSRFTLSYDFVFLALVRIALENTKTCPFSHWCVAHPFEKRACYRENISLKYSSAASAYLIEAKLNDDIKDNKGFKKIGSLMLKPFVTQMAKRARKNVEIPTEDITNALNALSLLESQKSLSIDEAANEFGKLLKSIFSFGLDGSNKVIAETIGMSIGRYIYVIDAIDDFDKDKRSGNYNPIVLSGLEVESLKIAINLELQNLASAVELIDCANNIEIIEIIKNITYEGLPNIASRVFDGSYMKGKK